MSDQLKAAQGEVDNAFAKISAGHDTLGLQVVSILGNTLMAIEHLTEAVQELEER